jgi:membrane protein YdbS with pleckstrin-like domain
MKNTEKSSRRGVSFMGLLTLIFITLKLCNVITWSWWWVLAPLWAGVAIVIVILLFSLIGLIIFLSTGRYIDKKYGR